MFLTVSNDQFDYNHIKQNIKDSKIIMVNQSKDLFQQTDDRYFIICFEKVIILLTQPFLNILDEFFIINPNLLICYLNNSKEYFTKKYKESPEIKFYDEMILNIRSEIHIFQKKGINFLNLWAILDECVYSYLIHKSYNKTKIDRILNLSSFDYEPSKIEIMDENEYIKLRQIDITSSSSVHLVYHTNRGELMVIKKDNGDSESTKLKKRELQNYKKIAHPFLPKIYGTTKKDNFLIIEYINGFTLDDIDAFNLNENEKITILFELIMIIEFLHRHKFIIRDIKPNNIIIDESKTAVLIDFDRMITQEDYLNTVNHTASFQSYFIAPEIFSNNFSNKCDIYSLGKIIYYLLEGMINDEENMIKYKNTEIERIYKRCIKINEKERPSITELLIDFYVNYHSQIQIKHFSEIYQNQLKHIYDDYTIMSLKIIELNGKNPDAYNRLGVLYSEDLYVKSDYKKAFHYFSLAAEGKHKKGFYNIGRFYYNGIYFKQDIKLAIHYFSLASDLGDEVSQYFLGCIYSNGKYVKINIKKSIHFFTLAANQNHVIAQYNLGLIYLQDNLIDIDKSIKYLKLAADQNDIDAQFILGTIYSLRILTKNQEFSQQLHLYSMMMNKINQQFFKMKTIIKLSNIAPYNLEETIHYYLLAAEKNHPLALSFLGMLYSDDEYITQDIKKSISFLCLAARYNNAEAIYTLGYLYEKGEKVQKNIKKALDFYLKAANLNHPIAQFVIGFRNCDGRYLPIDIEKGIYYLTLASNNKVREAQCTLGLVYYIMKIDINKSIYYFTLASDQNDHDAMYYLGLIYYIGKHVKRDLDKSINYFMNSSNSKALFNLGVIYYEMKNEICIDYFKKSADENNNNAQYALGMIYLNGTIVKKDIEQGIEYFKKCAVNDDIGVCFNLGFAYHEGKIIQQNISNAIYFYKKASTYNDSYSKNNLAIIYKNGFGDEIQQNLTNAIIYLKEAIEQKNDIVAMFNLASIYFYYEPSNDSIDESIKLLIKSTENNSYHSKYLLALIMLKKFDFDLKKIGNELKNHSQKLYEDVYQLIKKQKLYDETIFSFYYNYYKNFNLLYNQYKEKVLSLNKIAKKKNLSNEFYDAFGYMN